MGNVTEKLQYIADTKEAIKRALKAMGQTVADEDTFRSYADKIQSIYNAAYKPFSDFQALVATKQTEKLTGNNSTFATGVGDWVTILGGLTPDASTYPGNLYLACTTGNQCINCPGKVAAGASHGYIMKIKIKVQSGPGTTFQIGSFASAVDNNYGIDIVPTTESRWYYGYLHTFLNDNFYLGVVAANNNGTTFLIDEIHVNEVTLADLYDLDISAQAIKETTGLFAGLSKADQKLLQMNVMGDSILANPMGTIPALVDEGDTMRPTRLVSNNVVRQYYDDIKYNVPTFRRLDHAAWTKSGAVFGDFWMTNSSENEKIFRSVTENSWCEITVPNGVTECAIIYRTYYQVGGVDYDNAIAVALNGGSIAAYGATSLNTYTGIGNAENSHRIAHYTGLPAGANTIRLTKSNTTKVFDIWGAAYWNGDTMILNNHSQGGQPITNISAYARTIMANTGLTNWIIEFPNMNNCGQSLAVITQIKDLISLINSNLFKFDNSLFITTHPFGTDPSDGTPNYYTANASPLTFKQRSTLDIVLCVIFGLHYIDLFRLFEQAIIQSGGTLAGGQAGALFTNDGQHLDEDGVGIFAGYLLPRIPEIPA